MSEKDNEDMAIWKTPEDERLSAKAATWLVTFMPKLFKEMLQESKIEFSIEGAERETIFTIKGQEGLALNFTLDGIIKDIVLKNPKAKVWEFDKTNLEPNGDMDFNKKGNLIFRLRRKIAQTFAIAKNLQDLKSRLVELSKDKDIKKVRVLTPSEKIAQILDCSVNSLN